jgi:hypothetical protein
MLLMQVWCEQYQVACRAQDVHRKRRELAGCHVLGATGDVRWFRRIPRLYHHNYKCTVSKCHANRKNQVLHACTYYSNEWHCTWNRYCAGILIISPGSYVARFCTKLPACILSEIAFSEFVRSLITCGCLEFV